MARLSGTKAQRILEAARTWRETCLERDGSILNAGAVWTLENLRALEQAFLGNLIDDPSRSFYQKLEVQLAAQPRAVVCLAVELLWLILLFPAGISGRRKLDDLQSLLRSAGATVPPDERLFASSLDGGIGRPGMAYHVLRWKEFGFAMQAFRALKELDSQERARLLGNAWAFAEWLDRVPDGKNRAFRNILLYLLFPDTFERIAVSRHKRAIVRHFSAAFGRPVLSGKALRELSLVDLDRRMLDIRRQLEAKYPGQTIDFYTPPVSDQFRPSGPSSSGANRRGSDAAKAPASASSDMIQRLLPSDQPGRASLLSLLADAIDCAHRARPGAWAIVLAGNGIRLNVGRLKVLELRRKAVRLALLEDRLPAPVSEALRDRIRKGRIFKHLLGARLIEVSPDEFSQHAALLVAALHVVIEAAATTSKRPLGLRRHASSVVDYLESALDRRLPRPEHTTVAVNEAVVPETAAVSTPLAGFRATELDLDALVSDIENGDVGLPDIQRPFVWTATKVRDLFDSMYRGYPVGYLLFWQTASQQQGVRTIGVNEKAFQSPRRLIVDGQQRLTSLFAVMRGHQVLDENYLPVRLEIAFRPRDGRFEVADAAIRRDPEFIPDISTLLGDGRGSYTIIHEFLSNLSERRSLTDRDRQIMGQNLDRLFGLKRYRFSVIEISADLEEEAVADIFVRINSEGVKLKQGDFILTLLSVIWDEGRHQLEEFSRLAAQPPRRSTPTPYNHLISPSPDQLLRVGVAVGFRRARLKAVYQLLRGKDPDTGALVPERRQESLGLLRRAQSSVLDLTNWHQFLACVTAAGYRLAEHITSENGLLQAYALYLLGKALPGMHHVTLDRLLGRWFAMTSITGRYSSSPESAMEQDLARVGAAADAQEFECEVARIIESTLTNDFWEISLPAQLETSSIRSPGWSAFVAAQLRLNAPVLFSDKPLWSILDPLTRGHRRAFEVHHLFPKAWLIGHGFPDRKQTNQIANFALLEWPSNARAGARAPSDYAPELQSMIGQEAWERMCRLHALPANDWFSMPYAQFLAERRKLMANVIREGFQAL